MPDPEPTFAEAFERLRLSRGWIPAEVARRLGVYPTEVSRWRLGKGGISIRNVRKVADLFGVDRVPLERLAGYGDSSATDAQDTINPEIAAMYDADRAALEDELHGIPSPFWPAIFNAQRTARRLAVDLARAAIDIAQPQGAVSTPANGQLAPGERRQRRTQRRRTDSENGTLPSLLQFAGAG